MEIDDVKRDLLLAEYEAAHQGYAYRDELIPQEFAHMLQAFLLFLALIAAVQAFLSFNLFFGTIVFAVLGVCGFVCLSAFLLDIQANTSCKRALRERCAQIEQTLGPDTIKYWDTIAKRKMFRLEKKWKLWLNKKIERSAATVFVFAAWVLVFIFWPAVVFLVYFWGQVFNLSI